MLAQDHAQQVDIVVVELAVAARGSLGIDQALALQEPDLGDRHVGKLFEQQSEHFTDGQIGTFLHDHVSAVCSLEEDEAELADLQLVALLQHDLVVDPLGVEIRAVERAGVAHDVAVVGSLDLGVATRHGDVVEADLTVGMTAEARELIAQARTRRRPACRSARSARRHLWRGRRR